MIFQDNIFLNIRIRLNVPLNDPRYKLEIHKIKFMFMNLINSSNNYPGSLQ